MKLRILFTVLDSAIEPCTTKCPVLLVIIACAHPRTNIPVKSELNFICTQFMIQYIIHTGFKLQYTVILCTGIFLSLYEL